MSKKRAVEAPSGTRCSPLLEPACPRQDQPLHRNGKPAAVLRKDTFINGMVLQGFMTLESAASFLSDDLTPNADAETEYGRVAKRSRLGKPASEVSMMASTGNAAGPSKPTETSISTRRRAIEVSSLQSSRQDLREYAVFCCDHGYCVRVPGSRNELAKIDSTSITEDEVIDLGGDELDQDGLMGTDAQPSSGTSSPVLLISDDDEATADDGQIQTDCRPAALEVPTNLSEADRPSYGAPSPSRSTRDPEIPHASHRQRIQWPDVRRDSGVLEGFRTSPRPTKDVGLDARGGGRRRVRIDWPDDIEVLYDAREVNRGANSTAGVPRSNGPFEGVRAPQTPNFHTGIPPRVSVPHGFNNMQQERYEVNGAFSALSAPIRQPPMDNFVSRSPEEKMSRLSRNLQPYFQRGFADTSRPPELPRLHGVRHPTSSYSMPSNGYSAYGQEAHGLSRNNSVRHGERSIGLSRNFDVNQGRQAQGLDQGFLGGLQPQEPYGSSQTFPSTRRHDVLGRNFQRPSGPEVSSTTYRGSHTLQRNPNLTTPRMGNPPLFGNDGRFSAARHSTAQASRSRSPSPRRKDYRSHASSAMHSSAQVFRSPSPRRKDYRRHVSAAMHSSAQAFRSPSPRREDWRRHASAARHSPAKAFRSPSPRRKDYRRHVSAAMHPSAQAFRSPSPRRENFGRRPGLNAEEIESLKNPVLRGLKKKCVRDSSRVSIREKQKYFSKDPPVEDYAGESLTFHSAPEPDAVLEDIFSEDPIGPTVANVVDRHRPPAQIREQPWWTFSSEAHDYHLEIHRTEIDRIRTQIFHSTRFDERSKLNEDLKEQQKTFEDLSRKLNQVKDEELRTLNFFQRREHHGHPSQHLVSREEFKKRVQGREIFSSIFERVYGRPRKPVARIFK